MGVSSVNMGGGLGGATDGLLAFKLRFGGEKIPFQTFRIIPDSTNFESAFQVPAIEALSGNPFPPLEESC